MKLNMMDRPYFLIFVATAITYGFYSLDGIYFYYDLSEFLISTLAGTVCGLSIWLIHRVIPKRGSVTLGSRIGWYLGGYGFYPFVLFLALAFSGLVLFEYDSTYIESYISPLSTAIEYAFGETASRVFNVLVLLMLLMAFIFPWIIIPCLLVASLGYRLGGLAQRLVQRLAGQRVIARTDWRKEHPEGGGKDWESLCPILAILWTALVPLLAFLWSMWDRGEFEGL